MHVVMVKAAYPQASRTFDDTSPTTVFPRLGENWRTDGLVPTWKNLALLSTAPTRPAEECWSLRSEKLNERSRTNPEGICRRTLRASAKTRLGCFCAAYSRWSPVSGTRSAIRAVDLWRNDRLADPFRPATAQNTCPACMRKPRGGKPNNNRAVSQSTLSLGLCRNGSQQLNSCLDARNLCGLRQSARVAR